MYAEDNPLYQRNCTLASMGRQAALLVFTWWLVWVHNPSTFWQVWTAVGTVGVIWVTVSQWRYEAPLRDPWFERGQPLARTTEYASRPVTYLGPCLDFEKHRVQLGQVTLYATRDELAPAYVAAIPSHPPVA